MGDILLTIIGLRDATCSTGPLAEAAEDDEAVEAV
jgi:hypothetical protein